MFNTIEHILPESLGGGEWAILPNGMLCDACQNKFGSSIEQQALADYPLVDFRTFFAIPTKKRKAPWFKHREGIFTSSGIPGSIIYEPTDFFVDATLSGRKKHSIIPTECKRPDMVLRTLLKIGLEVVAADNGEIFNPKYDPARRFALTGEKDKMWFFILSEDLPLLNHLIKNPPTSEQWSDNMFMDVILHENKLEVLHLKLLYLDFMVPLIEDVTPDPEWKRHEPRIKVIEV